MPQKEVSASPSTGPSYVYPVRSLLTGIHAPVATPSAVPNAHGANYFDKRFSLPDTSECIEGEDASSEEPNFRHFPAEHTEQESFASQPRDPSSNADPVPQTVAGPTGELVSYVPDADRDPEQVNARHPEPISAAGAVALAEGAYTGSDSDSTRTQSSLASAGLVHLAPSRPDSHSPNRSSPAASFASGAAQGTSTPTEGSDSQGGTSSVRSDVQEQLVTFRFEHVQLGDQGHHVIVGREGKLAKCEDEVRSRVSARTSVCLHPRSPSPFRAPSRGLACSWRSKKMKRATSSCARCLR
jgi:hypothetical protein